MKIQRQIDTIKTATNNQQSATAWKIVNDISGRKGTPQAKFKGESQNERLGKWKEHFSNLLGKSSNVIDEEIETVIDYELPLKKDLLVWMN